MKCWTLRRETEGKALRVFSRLRLSIHTFSTDRCAGVEAARWRQFSEVKGDQTCKSEWIRVMCRSLAVTNTISKLQMRLSVLQLSIHGSMTNKDGSKEEMLHMASSLCQLHTHTHTHTHTQTKTHTHTHTHIHTNYWQFCHELRHP